MGRKKIEGTTHIRRKLDKRTKIAAVAISVIATLVSIFLFITKTEMGKGIQEKVSQVTTVVSEYRLPFASGSGSSPTSEVQSIIRVVGEVQRDDAGELKGYVSGGGTLSEGESMTLEATPFPGYVLDKWKVGGTDISSSNSITVGYNCTECNYNATGNVNIEALFKKQSDSVTYTVKLLPQIGRFSLKAAPYVGDDVNYQDVKNELNIVVNGSDNQFKRTFLYWQMTYSDLEQWFPSTSVNHSEGSNSSSGSNTSDTHSSDDGHDSHTEGSNNSTGTNTSDSYISSKTYTIAYDVYVFNKDGKVVWTYSDIAEKQEVNYPIEDPSAYIDINPYLHSYVADISDDASRSIFGEDCTILLAPHIEDGWEHGIITKADPQDGGLTTGDKVSSTMFASTITAMPSENYLFDHWSWTDNADGNRAMSSKDSSITVSPKGVVEYTAHFVPENYTIDLESCVPEDGGTISGLGTYAAHKDVDIQITPQPGYKIESWNYTTKDGKRFSGTSERFTINDLTSDVSISVKFTNGKSRIEVKASPIEGGNVTVRNATINPTDGIGEKPDYEEFVLGQEDAVLKAVVSNTDYVFAYWEDSEGRQYDGEIQSDGKTNILMIKNVASSEKFTAHFIKKALSVDVKVEPNTLASARYEAGEVDVTYTNIDDLTKTLTFYRPDIEPLNDIKAQTNEIIKAKENSGYHFVKFVDDKGKTYTDNPTVIVNVTDNLNLTAIYTPDEFDINAIASPVIGGKVIVNGKDGKDTVKYGDTVKLEATTAMGYMFDRFEDQNGNRYEGTVNPAGNYELSFEAINGAETYKAVFVKASVSFFAKIEPGILNTSGNYNEGYVNAVYIDESGSQIEASFSSPSRPHLTVKGQTNVIVTAVENASYHFVRFVDKRGNVYTENPTIISNISEDTELTAVYTDAEFEIKAVASPITGGTVTVDGKEGSNIVKYGKSVELVATCNTGYEFLYFEDQNGNHYDGTKNATGEYEFSFDAVNGAETYKAVFVKDNVSVSVTVAPKDKDAGLYTAGGYNITYVKYSNPGIYFSLADKYEDYTADDVAGRTNVTIKAIEKSGYHFSKFIDEDGNIYTENPVVLSSITKDKKIEVVFVPEEFEIKAISTPVTGGSVTVNGRDGSNTVSYNDEVTLVAKPKAEFDFRYFEDQNGNKYSGTVNASGEAELSFFAVNGAETYKAVFALKEVSVSVKVDPNTKTGGKYNAGGYRVDYIDPSGSAASSGALYEEKKIEHIKGQTSVKITAIEGDGYHFSKFIDSEGNTWNDNPMVLGDLVENKSIEVIYVPDKFTISAQASPSTGGTVDVQVNHNGDITKREGSNTVAYNDEVTLIAKPKTGFGFRYFEDQNGNKYSGTIKNPGTASETYEMSFKAVNGSETYKAVFAFDKVNVTVKVDPNTLKNGKYAAGYGEVTYTDIVSGESVTKTVDYDDSTIDDIKGQTSIKINAIARTGYHFSKFIDSEGNTWTENPMVLGDLVENKDIEIIFVPDEFTIEAKALPVTGGVVTVNGREGSNTVKYDDEVTLIATPKSANFEFRYFEDQYGNQYKKDLVDPVTGIAVFKFKAVNGSETYKAIFAMKDITYNISVDPDTMADGKYVAGGYEITYKKQDGTEETLTRYEKAAISGIKGQTDVKIRALEKDGYHFERFIDSKGQSHTENPLIVHDVVENEDITIIFVEDELTVNVVVTPDKGGTATANGKAGTSKVKYGEMVSVVAKANSGYMFRYFEDQDGNHYEGITNADGSHTYSFKAVNASTTYKAVFVMQTIELEMVYDPNDMSKSGAIVTYQSLRGEQIVTDPTRNQINDIVGMTDIKIKAVEKSGYKFAKFVDGTGKVYTDNPLILPNVTENQKITVIFVEEHWRIEVKSYPEAGGRVLANGIEGGIDADYGDNIKLEAKANEGYTFKYFRDSAGNDYLSNPLEFEAINGNETYTAYFAKNSVTVTIDLTPKGSGTVRFNSEPAVSTRTTYPAEGLSNVTLTAQSKTETQFVCWRDQDGNSYTDNPLTIVDISTDLIFTAVFEGETTGVRAIASPPSGGKIRKIINDDGSITLIATANRGYTFTHWKKPNGMTLASKFTIPANQVKVGDTYIAYFKYNKNYDAKSDITKESFYREWRKVVTPNYTVTRDSMKLLAMQTVSGLRQYDDATPPLKNYQAVSNAQAYFDAKLAEEIKRLDGLFGDAELMTAEAEELTPDMLPDINKYQTIAEDFTAKKFGHLYETEILTVKKVIEPQNFDNRKRTYLWRYTGAEFKENIYLLYDINDKKPKWVSPIVDMDGVLKFTLDELKDKDVVAVVRVKIKQ